MKREAILDFTELAPGDLIQYGWITKPQEIDSQIFLFLSLEQGIKSLSGMIVPGQSLTLMNVKTNEKSVLKLYHDPDSHVVQIVNKLFVYRLTEP